MDRFKALLREPALILDFFESAIVLAVALGFLHLTGEAQRDLIALLIALVATFLGTAMTVLQRAQVTPRFDPVVEIGGAGAGPVRGEAGFMAVPEAMLVAFLATVLVVTAGNAWMASSVGVVTGAGVLYRFKAARTRLRR